MASSWEQLATHWPWSAALTLTLALALIVYARGWRRLRLAAPHRFGAKQLGCFTLGMIALGLALSTPLETLADYWLRAHMAQHLLLTMVAPPLIWLGAPLAPCLRGLPRFARRLVTPLLADAWTLALGRWLVRPLVAWSLFVATSWLWHWPRFYSLALESSDWHLVQHTAFFATSMLFWWPVVLPYPARLHGSRAVMIPYLVGADLQNTILSALLTFSPSLLYPHYGLVPRLGGTLALDDQAAAGAMMWVGGSLAFLGPAVSITLGVLRDRGRRRAPAAARARAISPVVVHRPMVRPVESVDLLRGPLIGPALRWRHTRTLVQVTLAALAAIVVVDGLWGPSLAALNFAGILPWIHWRGLVVIGALMVGNWACYACPLTLLRRLVPARATLGARWPGALRNKYLVAFFLVIFFAAYEIRALWDDPWLTAWIVIGYFVVAGAIDLVFRDRPFCRYVCPVGQFNFVYSLVAPWQVRARDPAICARCATHECLRGAASLSIAGCGAALFQPQKQSNLDCTFCLECARSCPHQNVGLLATAPSPSLSLPILATAAAPSSTTRRTRLEQFDVAVLIYVLAAAALVNAASMTAPVIAWQDQLAGAWFAGQVRAVVALSLLLTLVLIPTALVALLSWITSRLLHGRVTVLQVATRMAPSLVPLTAAMWLAHYSFHFLTGWWAIITPLERSAATLGIGAAGTADVFCACCVDLAPNVLRAELIGLGLGLVWSITIAIRKLRDPLSHGVSAKIALLMWSMLLVSYYLAAVWIVLQPMQMRGLTSLAGSGS